MSSDLIALIVAIGLGLAVVVLGWRRDLGKTTRNWLPRFGKAPEQAPAMQGPSAGGQKRRQLSPRQWRFAISIYLLFSLGYAVLAIGWADDRLQHAIFAAIWATGAVVTFLRRPAIGPR